MDQLRVESLLRHQCRSAVGGALAFAADAEHVDVVTYQRGNVDGNRLAGKCCQANAPAALEHACRVVHRRRRARALKHIVRASMGIFLDLLDHVFARDVDGVIRSKLAAHFKAVVAGPGEDHLAGAQGLGNADAHQADRAGAHDHHRLSGNQTADNVEPVHGGAGGDDQCRLLVAHVLGNMGQGVDIVDRVLREAAIGGEAVGAVPLIHLAIVFAVVQASGVHALAAAFAATATGVHFDRHPVADMKLVDALPEFDHGTHVLVARRKVLVERQPPLKHRGRALVNDLQIGRADRNRVDPHQHLGRARLGHGFVDQRELVRVAQHPGLHRFRNPVGLAAKRRIGDCIHRDLPLSLTALRGGGAIGRCHAHPD